MKIFSHLSKKRCGYCRRGNETHTRDELIPQGFCIDAYYAVYPYLLALLYDARFQEKKRIIVKCPNPDNPARIEISFRPKKMKAILNLIEKISRKLGHPKDAIDKVMAIKVIDAGASCHLRKGDLAWVKIPNMREFCPASFFSLYPFLFQASRSDALPGEAGKIKNVNFACPDPKTNICYTVDLGDAKERPNGAKGVTEKICFPVSNIAHYRVLTMQRAGCELRSWNKKEVSLDMILPAGICPNLFAVALPYIITFQHGGYFKWSADMQNVSAQCPDPEGGVAFTIDKKSGDGKKLSLTITAVQGCCPRMHKMGQAYELDFSQLVCPHLFIRLFPYLLLREGEKDGGRYKDGIVITCPFEAKDMRYVLIKKETLAPEH